MSNIHTVRVGDTLTPLGVELLQNGTAVNLTGKTVKVLSYNAATGVAVVAETTTGVTVTSASLGLVAWDLPSAQVTTAGRYKVYFRVYSSDERDTYPAIDEMLLDVVAIP